MVIRELELVAPDLPALRTFWTDTLGLVVRDQRDAIVVECGASRLRLRAGEQGGSYHVAFNIPTNRFTEAKTWLSTRVPLHSDSSGADEFDFANWNAHSVYFADPAGNILELIARHGLANATDHQFGAKDIISISEIGLAVDDVAETVGELTRALDTPVYDGAGSDSFSAVGDEHGLLIVVAKQRIWYPDTAIAAVALPLRIVVEAGVGRCVIDADSTGRKGSLAIRVSG